MIIQLDTYGHYIRCFSSFEAAKEYYTKAYGIADNWDIIKAEYDEEDHRYYITVLSKYKDEEEQYSETLEFIDAVVTV